MNNFKKAVDFLRKAENIAVLTGAGVSAESGVPTFRGRGGLWKKFRAEELATPEAFKRDPILVWKFYDYRRQLISRVHPNKAHEILAMWENRFENLTIVTQNIDGLHQRAGSKKVIELHGNIWEAQCIKENKIFKYEENPIKKFPPKCPGCGSLIRPNVVWFGESLDSDILNFSFSLFEKSALALVIGTSSVVYPAAHLPILTKRGGGKIMEINMEETSLTSLSDIFLKGKASEILKEIDSLI